MSFDSMLNKRCNIEQKTITQDSYGQQQDTWNVVIAGAACRIDERGGGLIEAPEEVFESARHVLFMRPPVSVTLTTEAHRIVLEGTRYKIVLIGDYYQETPMHHLEILLEEIK